jgi:glutaredoxin 3
MSRVLLYTTPWCGHCLLAKKLLEERAIPFDEIDVANDPQRRAKLIAETGHRTVPVIFIDGRFIGGRQELYALDGRGELERLGLVPNGTQQG